MKKRKIAVFVMGLSLPLWGWFAGAVLRLFFSTGFLCLVSLAVLAVWALMGFFAEDILEDTVQAVFFLNLPLLTVLTWTISCWFHPKANRCGANRI